MKWIISGGGTGGHIYPAIAILDEIQKRDKGAQILYIGKNGSMEESIAKDRGLDFEGIRVEGLPRKVNRAFFHSLGELSHGLGRAKKLIKNFDPDCVIGTGGFVSGPVLFVAALKGYKTLIHEQNSLPGLTNRILSRHVDRICLTYESSKRYLKDPSKAVVTGNPIRASFAGLKPNKAMYESYGLDEDKKIVFLFGGSNGSRSINKAVADMLVKLDSMPFQLILATGKSHYDGFMEEVKESKFLDQVAIRPYLYDIGSAYALADLVVTSSGAITLAELSSLALPSILIPKSYTADNHQVYNAELYRDQGASEMILEKDLNWQSLYDKINKILKEDEALKIMGENARKLQNPRATEDIVDQVMDLVEGGRSDR